MNRNSKTINVSNLGGVPETLLIPLFCRAQETKENGIIQDDYATKMINQIDYDFSEISKDWKTHNFIIVRTQLLDKIVQDLSNKINDLTVVNLGSGLDTRQLRFSNIKWCQLDLPEVIKLRKSFNDFKDENNIEKSVLDFSWIHDIREKENVLFIAEGLLFYFEEEEVKSIFQHIGNNFKNSYIAFDTIPELSTKAKKSGSVNQDNAPLKWFNYKLKTIEDWQFGFEEVVKFPMLSEHKKRWKGFGYLNLIPKFKNGFKVALMKINH